MKMTGMAEMDSDKEGSQDMASEKCPTCGAEMKAHDGPNTLADLKKMANAISKKRPMRK
jgi:transcription initiation factor IIE alpha subunit